MAFGSNALSSERSNLNSINYLQNGHVKSNSGGNYLKNSNINNQNNNNNTNNYNGLQKK